MDKEHIRQLAMRLTREEKEHLRRLHLHGVEDASAFGGSQDILKWLEVHDLVYRSGSAVSLTHRGKLVARII